MSPTFSQFAYSGNPLVRMNLAANLYDTAHRLQKDRFTLVLLALRLPDSQGLDTFRRFREISSDTPVAVLLQHDEWYLEHDVREMGALAAYSPGQVNVDEVIGLCREYARPVEEKDENDAAPAEAAAEPAEPAEAVKEIFAEASGREEPAPEATLENSLPAEADGELTVPLNDAPAADDAEITINDLHDAEEWALEITAAPETPDAPETVTESTTPEPDAPETATPETPAPAADAALAPAQETEEAAEVTATPEPLNLARPEATDAAERAAARAEMVRLRKELKHHRAVRQELEGVSKALEERCRELEAGQAALIEAEHVAIEREKAARLAAEARLEEMTRQFGALQNVEQQRQALAADIKSARADDTRVSELEESNRKLRAELETVKERVHEQRDVVEHSEQAVSYLKTKVETYKQRAETAEGSLQKLEVRFKKLHKAYNKACVEKKNHEKTIGELEQENQKILQKSKELTAMYEKAQCEHLCKNVEKPGGGK